MGKLIKNKSSNKSRNFIYKMKGGGNYFYSVLTGTLGYFAATFLYGIMLVLIFIGLGGGIYLIYTAKECETIEEETTFNNNDNEQKTNRLKRKNTKTECKSYNELDGIAKTKFIVGCILTTIFGLLLLTIIIPFIIEGFGRFTGYMLAGYAADEIF